MIRWKFLENNTHTNFNNEETVETTNRTQSWTDEILKKIKKNKNTPKSTNRKCRYWRGRIKSEECVRTIRR